MRRGNKRKFGKTRNLRRDLYRSLAIALIDHGRITTSAAKAKSLSSYINKMVTIAKKKSLSARRMLVKDLGPAATKKIVDTIAQQFDNRAGGYTRVVSLGRRKSDSAPMAIIEFTK